jgi:anaerobic magnesium-protoporphyrin IX monomethyl ester cyclase
MMENEVLLIMPELDPSESIKFPPRLYDNLGLGYLASYLETRGIGTKIIDLNSSRKTQEDLIKHASSKCYQVIGISSGSANELRDAKTLASKLKNAGIKSHITVGGHYATSQGSKILMVSDDIDSVVRGEGEETLCELFLALNEKGQFQDILGLSYRIGGEIVGNRKRPAITNLDSIPFPRRYNLDNLIKSRTNGRGVYVLSSRGCPGGCSFCVAPINPGWRARSAENVVSELSELNRLGVKQVNFCDENFVGNSIEGRERAIEIARKIKERRLELKFHTSFRVDDYNSEMIEEMIEAGLTSVNMGIESFNQRQLDLYNKRVTLDQALKAIEGIVEKGVDTRFSFIMFDPYINLEEVRNNLQYSRKYFENVSFRNLRTLLEPIRGSVILERIKKDGLLVDKENGKYSFGFVNPELDDLWGLITQFRKSTKGLEDSERRLHNQIMLYEVDESQESLDYLCGMKKEIDLGMTLMWLDFMDYACDLVDRKKLKSFEIPPQVRKQKDKLIEKLIDVEEVLENES